jgi:hypothetical protein
MSSKLILCLLLVVAVVAMSTVFAERIRYRGWSTQRPYRKAWVKEQPNGLCKYGKVESTRWTSNVISAPVPTSEEWNIKPDSWESLGKWSESKLTAFFAKSEESKKSDKSQHKSVWDQMKEFSDSNGFF